jgi:hypothetical protein
MLQEPKTSPFAYGLAAVLAVVGWFILRPTPPAPPASPPVAARSAPSGPMGTTLTESSDQDILDAFATALARAGLPPMRSPRDVFAVLLTTRPPPIPSDADAAAFAAAIQRRRDAIEGALVAASVFLNQEQLVVFRAVLERDLAALIARGAAAKPGSK